jgi:hypothetical protein
MAALQAKPIPESCMNNNEMSIYLSITKGCKNLGGEANSYPGKKNYSQFYLINFHPLGFAFSYDPTGRASRKLSFAALLGVWHRPL